MVLLFQSLQIFIRSSIIFSVKALSEAGRLRTNFEKNGVGFESKRDWSSGAEVNDLISWVLRRCRREEGELVNIFFFFLVFKMTFFATFLKISNQNRYFSNKFLYI